MSFSAYLAYKDSGIEWIGVTPTHWIISSLKRGFRIEGGSTPSPEEVNWDGDIAWVTPADLSGLKSLALDVSKRTITAAGLASCGTNLLPKGSLILSTRAPIGSLAIALISMCTNQGCKGLVPNTNTSSSYFAYLLIAAKDELNNRGRGTTFLEISGDELSRFDVPMPPFTEQTQIARFLDHETVRIDALIEEQLRLIELLKEKRQAVISLAVTKGLDPTVPMKNSGVEWLGEVPAHWSVAGLKWFWSVTDCKHITADFVDDGIPLASIREVQSRYVSLEYARQTTKEFYLQLIEAGREPAAGDLIFSRNATVGEVAQVANWHPPFALGQDVCLLKRKYKWLSSDYLQVALLSTVVKVQLDNLMIGSTFKRVNVEDIRGLNIPMPPHEEQKLIADYLSKETEFFDALLSEAKSTIGLLHERRSSLISAAVTGKIDVRGWKPPASATVQELEKETK